jgi:hypothetical protein
MPYPQRPFGVAYLVVQADGDARTLAGDLRRAVRSAAPALPLEDVRPLDAIVDDALPAPHARAWLVGSIAGVAALLTIAGLYGIVAFATHALPHHETDHPAARRAQRHADPDFARPLASAFSPWIRYHSPARRPPSSCSARSRPSFRPFARRRSIRRRRCERSRPGMRRGTMFEDSRPDFSPKR